MNCYSPVVVIYRPLDDIGTKSLNPGPLVSFSGHGRSEGLWSKKKMCSWVGASQGFWFGFHDDSIGFFPKGLIWVLNSW